MSQSVMGSLSSPAGKAEAPDLPTDKGVSGIKQQVLSCAVIGREDFQTVNLT
jgi:hypothetical protein